MKKLFRIFGSVLLMVLLAVSPALSADLYIAQTAAGGDTGANCANAKAISYLSGAWAGKVSAGDTVHLCGTLTSTLTVGASGSAGSVITILFESGAKFSKTAWDTNGAINISSKNYITIDGDNTGIIESTDNGTAPTYGTAQQSYGIYMNTVDHVTIKDLTIQNMYVAVPDGNNGDSTSYGRAIYLINGSNLTITGNTITEGEKIILLAYSAGNENWTISNNTISNAVVGITVGSSGADTTLDNVVISGNTIDLGTNHGGCWQTAAACDTWHHTDGVHVYAKSSAGSSVTNLVIRDNLVGPTHSTYEKSGTKSTVSAYLYTEGDPGSIASPLLYNNVLVAGAGYIGAADGFWYGKSNTSPGFYNNTIIGQSTSVGTGIITENSTDVSAKNNTIQGVARIICIGEAEGSSDTIASSGAGVNYNSYYNFAATNAFEYRHNRYNDVATWNTAQGADATNVSTDPSLSATYAPDNAGDPVVGAGTNLAAIFTTDKNGVTRTVPWDIGAYKYGTGTTTWTITYTPTAPCTSSLATQVVADGATGSTTLTVPNGYRHGTTSSGTWSGDVVTTAAITADIEVTLGCETIKIGGVR